MKFFNILFNLTMWFFLFLPIKITFPHLYKIIFQNKYYKLKEDINEGESEEIKEKWKLFIIQHNVLEEYKNDCIETLEYFAKFDTTIIFDSQKTNPQYMNIYYMFHIVSLAKEAIKHLKEVTADNKKVAYYESNNNASLDTLMQHYMNKLNAKNEDKLSSIASRNEVRLKRYIIKLKKHDSLFMNFYLMLFTIYPIENLNIKKKDKESIELIEDIFEFVRIGHATENQIHKSVAIQLYKLYEENISKINLSTNTTEEELKIQIGKLIDFTFQTDKAYKNFNNTDQEAYIKNVIYNFPVFECDNYLAKGQIRRFKFYFTGKNSLLPEYIPKFIRKLILNKFFKTPLSTYSNSVFTTLFGSFRKKI